MAKANVPPNKIRKVLLPALGWVEKEVHLGRIRIKAWTHPVLLPNSTTHVGRAWDMSMKAAKENK